MRSAQDKLITDFTDKRVLQRINHAIIYHGPLIVTGLLEEADPGAGPFFAAFYPAEQVTFAIPFKRNRNIIDIKPFHVFK